MNYKLTIAYDGTAYHGWQVQKDAATIAGTIQATFHKIFNKNCFLVGASRTDAGVHALGQVALLQTDLLLEPEIIQRVLNSHLPADILIRACEIVPEVFYPQHNVLEKTYYYHFSLERPVPFIAKYGFYYRFPLDLEKLQKALQLFVGTHDFRSFCTGDDYATTIRTINSITYSYNKKYALHRITVKGPGFLRYMIRRIVGASLDIASDENTPISAITTALEEKNPQQQFTTAPAQGLLLRKILYNQ